MVIRVPIDLDDIATTKHGGKPVQEIVGNLISDLRTCYVIYSNRVLDRETRELARLRKPASVCRSYVRNGES